MKQLPSGRVLCTPYNHAPCHFTQSHIRKVHACLAVTCHLHFWQNNRDLLPATAVTRGWNGYRNKGAMCSYSHLQASCASVVWLALADGDCVKAKIINTKMGHPGSLLYKKRGSSGAQ